MKAGRRGLHLPPHLILGFFLFPFFLPIFPSAYDALRLLLVKPKAEQALKHLPAGSPSADSVIQRVVERGG
jgi:hypothetical protein